MDRKTIRIIYDFITADESNVGMIIFTLFAFILMNTFDIFDLKDSKYWGETGASIVYLLFVFLLYYSWAAVKLFHIREKIHFHPVYITETSKKVKRGHTLYTGLEIEIPEGWEITDCYVTIEKMRMVYDKENVLLDPKLSTWLADRKKPEFKRLAWKSPYASLDGKLTIGDNTNKEIILVGQVSKGYVGTSENLMEIENFEFALVSTENSKLIFESFGLYTLSMSFHWTQNGKRMIPKPFNGYLYATMRGSFPKLILKEGDYSNDNEIPIGVEKPVVQSVVKEVENVSQKTTKITKRKSPKRTKKRSPHKGKLPKDS